MLRKVIFLKLSVNNHKCIRNRFHNFVLEVKCFSEISLCSQKCNRQKNVTYGFSKICITFL